MTDKPTTALGMLALLIVKCDSSAELAGTSLDRIIFKELAAEARQIDKAVSAERASTVYRTLEARQRANDERR